MQISGIIRTQTWNRIAKENDRIPGTRRRLAKDGAVMHENSTWSMARTFATQPFCMDFRVGDTNFTGCAFD